MARKLTRIVLRLTDIKDLTKFVDSMEKNKTNFNEEGKKKIEKLATEIESKYTKPLLAKLKTYPPVRDRTRRVRWDSDKQRRFVMMLWSKGMISLPYIRTGKLAAGWKVDVNLKWSRQAKLGILRIVVTNDENYANYVMGDYGLGETAKTMTQYLKPMQPFHKDTGWQPAFPPIQEAFKGIKQTVSTTLTAWSPFTST